MTKQLIPPSNFFENEKERLKEFDLWLWDNQTPPFTDNGIHDPNRIILRIALNQLFNNNSKELLNNDDLIKKAKEIYRESKNKEDTQAILTELKSRTNSLYVYMPKC